MYGPVVLVLAISPLQLSKLTSLLLMILESVSALSLVFTAFSFEMQGHSSIDSMSRSRLVKDVQLPIHLDLVWNGFIQTVVSIDTNYVEVIQRPVPMPDTAFECMFRLGVLGDIYL